jgi:hypothetical protein
MKLGAMLALKLVDMVADYLKARRLEKQAEALRRSKLLDTEYESEVDAVLHDLGIHHGGRNPTRRITLKPKPETLVKASRETGA